MPVGVGIRRRGCVRQSRPFWRKQGISSIVGTDVYNRIAGSDYSPNNIADLTIIAAKEMRASSVGIGQIRVDEINTTPPCSCQGHTLARPTNDPKAAESVLSAG